MNIGQISDSSIKIKPSESLLKYISKIKTDDDMPSGIFNIVFKNKRKLPTKSRGVPYLMTDQDWKFLNSLETNSDISMHNTLASTDDIDVSENEKFLDLRDLHWLYHHLRHEHVDSSRKVYLHELLEGSQIVLPKNSQIPRNPVLEKRCQQLRIDQQNREYHKMTKNVDNIRRRHPEDTIAYQIKQMNRHLIAVFQFIVSVLAGFTFGFLGVELLIGTLDFGFRLLLGIICALIIALAELYFLAKKLNEDLQFETAATQTNAKSTKVD